MLIRSFGASFVGVMAAIGVSVSCSTPPASTSTWSLNFGATVNDTAFACADFEGIGTSGTRFTPTDFRLYVHGFEVVNSDGTTEALTLDSNTYQNGGVALLDFSDGAGCDDGAGGLNTTLTFTGRQPSGVVRLRFRIGVPQALNHLNSSIARSPLNLSSMFWGWQAGYKFIRLEGRTAGLPQGFLFHLGSMNCSGDAIAGTRTCAEANVPTIEVQGDLNAGRITFDVAAILAGVNVDQDAGGSPGCMSDRNDPECPLIFSRLGLTDQAQTVVRFASTP